MVTKGKPATVHIWGLCEYRPFASFDEYRPHRNRWARRRGSEKCYPVSGVENGELLIGTTWYSWAKAYELFEFDDTGGPFGMKVDGSFRP